MKNLFKLPDIFNVDLFVHFTIHEKYATSFIQKIDLSWNDIPISVVNMIISLELSKVSIVGSASGTIIIGSLSRSFFLELNSKNTSMHLIYFFSYHHFFLRYFLSK